MNLPQLLAGLLLAISALTLGYCCWNRGFPYLVFVIGHLPFFLLAYWIQDFPGTRQIPKAVGMLASAVAGSLLVFGGVLGWL